MASVEIHGRDTRLFGSDSVLPDLAPQTATEKIAKQGMEAILFRTRAFTDDRQKDVVLRKLGQQCGAPQVGKQLTAIVERERFQKRQMEQKLLRRFGFPREDLFGKIIENVLFRMSQSFEKVEFFLPVH